VPETYKGLTVPQYSDTADGVAAIRNLVDSGPIARVNDEQLGALGEDGPEVGTIVYYETLNVLLQWCGPTMTWKPLWASPWGRVNHWSSSVSSQHSSTETTVAGMGNMIWTAYANRYYRVTVTGRLYWNDFGTGQGNPGWTVDGSIARAVVRIKRESDNEEILRVYDGRGGFMYGDDIAIFSTTLLVDNLDGEQDWKLTAQTANNQTTDDFLLVGEFPTTVLIEDIGPSGAPT
jgi:hypothetical protein